MNKRLTQLLLSVFFVGVFNNCLAQGEVNVNNFSGTASVRIPLIEFNMNSIGHGVFLQYDAKSVKVKHGVEEIAPGWKLEGQGSIQRVLRGLPDEKKVSSGDNRSGWMEQSNHVRPTAFTITDDNDESTCTDELANYNAIHNTFGYVNDPEPDWFVVDAPGLKCKLILDNNNNFRAIPAQNIKVELIYPNGEDPLFIITNASGIKYTFASLSKVTKSVTQTRSDYDIFNREYEYFKTPISYITTWHLSKISSPGNEYNAIEFLYSGSMLPGVVANTANVENLFTGFDHYTFGPNNSLVYNNIQKLVKISTTQGQSIEIVRYPDREEIDYFNIGSNSASTCHIKLNRSQVNTNWSFLESITETIAGCSSKSYQFEYHGCDFNAGTTLLPSDEEASSDFWGNFHAIGGSKLYVYPSIGGTAGIYRPYQIPNYQGESYLIRAGVDAIDEELIKAGVMSKITYPTGGSSSFEYESNSFWAEDAGIEIKGAGVRIKTLRHFDGISPEKSMITTYHYNIPGQSRTSGTIKALPSHAITANSYYAFYPNRRLYEPDILALCSAQSADYWKYHTLSSNIDMSSGNHDVQYEYVTVKNSLAGKTEYKYSISSTLWSLEGNSMVYIASACGSAKYPNLPVRKGYNQYPAPPKDEKDYADGLLIQEKVYTENNAPVRVTDYEYEDYYTNPPIIYAVVFDRVYGNDMFSKYSITVNDRILKKQKETIYDTGVGGNMQVAEVIYDNSGPDRQIRTKTVVNSDNSITKTNYKYSGDFPFHASDVTSDPYAEGVYLLNQKNMKHVVIEELTKKKEAGAIDFKVYDGELTLYKKSSASSVPALNDIPLLAEIKAFKSKTGVSNFGEVALTNGALTAHPSYRSRQKFESYDEFNLPQLITKNRIKTAIYYNWPLHIPEAEFYGAELKNIAYGAFEGGSQGMQIENELPTDVAYESHTGYFGRVLRPGNSLYKDFIKATGAKFYTISAWVKSSGAATVTVLLNNSAVVTINCAPSNEFVFYQKQIDVSSIPDNSVVKLISSQNVLVDNVVFCPQETSYLINSYTFPFGKSAETTSSGKTIFYEYDAKGRPTYTRDGNRNILQFNNYQGHNTTAAMLSAYFERQGNTFSTSNNCLTGVKCNWNFGDGTTLETYDPSVNHNFPPGGPHTVTLTVTHPDLGTKTYTQTFYMPLVVTICAAGVTVKDVCGFDPIQYGDCSAAYNPPPTGATLYVTDIVGGNGETFSYEWQKYVGGDLIWSPNPIGTNNYFEQPLFLGSYGYRCKVTGSSGNVGYSNTIGLNYYQSQPNCPLPNEN